MEINVHEDNRRVSFGTLALGAVFHWDGLTFIKRSNAVQLQQVGYNNSLCLSDNNEDTDFGQSNMVSKVKRMEVFI